MNKPPFYVVSNGRLLLHLEPAEEGGYLVTSPYDPDLITEADSLEEAFENAEDAALTLAEDRAEQIRSKKDRNGSAKSRRETART